MKGPIVTPGEPRGRSDRSYHVFHIDVRVFCFKFAGKGYSLQIGQW